MHDTFLIVIDAIRRGCLRQPERLAGFVRTIVSREIAHRIDEMVRNRHGKVDIDANMSDRRQNPEQEAIMRQQREIMLVALKSLREVDREILIRFYLHEQSWEQICNDLHITETQFRTLKWRAKEKFGKAANDLLSQRNVGLDTKSQA